MTKIKSLSTIAAALLACGLSAVPAHARATRTWVSGTGSDTNPCTLALPCLTFAVALTQTAAKGEISVLDSGDFGPVTITQAISIVNDGAGVAAIGSFLENAVTVNAGLTDSVHLRGLTIEALGGGSSGVRFLMGGNLAIENCVIRNFANAGINISVSTSSSFSVSNTIVSNSGDVGIRIHPTGAAVVTGVLRKVTANNNLNGILVDGAATTGASLTVTIADSEASNNGSFGVLAFSVPGNAATAVMVRNSSVSNNISFGLVAQANTTLWVGHSKFSGNGIAMNKSNGGVIYSYGDNDINGNTTDNTGVPRPRPTH